MRILDVFAIAYLDNIMIYFETLKIYQRHVKDVLAQLHQFHLFCKLFKCEFGVMTTSFLGFVMSTSRVSMESNWVESILNWPKPRSHRDIQVFLGFANFYQQFIEGFAWISFALSSMLKGGKKSKFSGKFTLDVEAKIAFEWLKAVFIIVLMLHHFNPMQKICIKSNVSEFAVSAVISQLELSTG